MASMELSLALSHTRPRRSTYRFIHRPVQCSTQRGDLFNRIAPVYDNLNDLFSLSQHRVWKRLAVSWSGAKMGDFLLDLSCGSGDLAFLFSEKVGSQGKVIGLDFSKELLSIASSRQQLLSKPCYENIEWVESGALDLPFSDDYFDAITMGYGLRHVVVKRRAMQEIFGVLKEGSRVSILDFNKSTVPITALVQEWMIDNVVVPVAASYGLADEYRYLKSSINELLTDGRIEPVLKDWFGIRKKQYAMQPRTFLSFSVFFELVITDVSSAPVRNWRGLLWK